MNNRLGSYPDKSRSPITGQSRASEVLFFSCVTISWSWYQYVLVGSTPVANPLTAKMSSKPSLLKSQNFPPHPQPPSLVPAEALAFMNLQPPTFEGSA